MPTLTDHVSAHLAFKSLPPSQQWLADFVASIRPNTPLPALLKTAEFRLLGTDITASLQVSPQSFFPAGISNPDISELRIPGPIPVQVLDIEDIGRSRWSQIEAMEMEDRGETRKGQEIIRVVLDADGTTDMTSTLPMAAGVVGEWAGPHKLLLQDVRGTKAYGVELEAIKGVDVTAIAIGGKLLLRDFTVARGVLILERKGVEILGGRIDAWDKRWREERKKVLKERAGWREERLNT